ncbi:30S ribosomal protein S8 [Mycoplasmopsis agassizii]|uniref:Small ribosomal subunit protein uS8 n=1 Tax=Mycoplasmopsis agassizii TaxID=33922 RepID=A0A1W1X2X7_9BACT|nr:30S ribosomal protein S8 [Mycoplasmopsis agassizii]PAF55393.1 30S ribosomal protein S8 [Mycoplasmopsis agassizii]PAK21670.1 30S ribosomal protein S8 [Mycoplasmopsis agassizii]SMC18257.1 small subunit ribosomal protein S8 [Mycoplasmopsis agassizii]
MAFIIDPIADMLTRIKNAVKRKHKNVAFPYSNIKERILEIMAKEGFIVGYTIEGNGVEKTLVVELKYKGSTSAIFDLKRVSKPSLRVYVSANEVPNVLNGFGLAIISTSKGLLTDKQARKENIGGEVIAYIW